MHYTLRRGIKESGTIISRANIQDSNKYSAAQNCNMNVCILILPGILLYVLFVVYIAEYIVCCIHCLLYILLNILFVVYIVCCIHCLLYTFFVVYIVCCGDAVVMLLWWCCCIITHFNLSWKWFSKLMFKFSTLPNLTKIR